MTTFSHTFAQIRHFPKPFWILISAILINQIGNAAMVFLVLYLTQQVHLSLQDATYAFAIYGFSMLLTGLFGGTLIDKFGSISMLVITLIINSLILIIFPILNHVASILFMCAAWGFIFGLYRPACQTFASLISPPGLQKITFAVFRLAINLGMSIGPAIAGYLADYSYTSIFVLNSISNLIAAAILVVGFRKTKYQNTLVQTSHPIPLELSIKWIKHDALLRWFAIGLIPISMVFFQHETTMATFLTEELKFSPSFYGLLFTINTLIIVFFELPLNIAIISWPFRLNFAVGCFFLTLGFAGLLFATLKWHVILLIIFITLGEMILYPSASTYAAELGPPERRGSYMSIYNACSNIGLFLGPLCGGFILSHFAYQGLWVTCGLWGLMSILIFSFMPMTTSKLVTKQNIS